MKLVPPPRNAVTSGKLLLNTSQVIDQYSMESTIVPIHAWLGVSETMSPSEAICVNFLQEVAHGASACWAVHPLLEKALNRDERFVDSWPCFGRSLPWAFHLWQRR